MLTLPCNILCSQSSLYEEPSLMGSNTVYSIETVSEKRVTEFAAYFMLHSCLEYSTTLKTETTRSSSETSVMFKWTRRCYIHEEGTLPNSIISYVISILFEPKLGDRLSREVRRLLPQSSGQALE
jgi:hypothetical protein